ncbi:hypothetical protein Nepgr_017168 [Nepenthes gracilis]|uniref:PAS domain-containing protein n=1 Tax=Nepenthes gracilis TaxID=150966 RepID=A0AAD3XRX6_NEPGR|nr:hypothetical protein Nepgr_017168 [Nepenthes gracilis]
MESPLSQIQESFILRYSSWVNEALDELPDSFTITDPCISGHPIVFASRGFLKMSGYSKAEVIGRNGRIFQGPATNRRSVMEIREAIREERSLQISLLNYRKDGTPFWMLFHMSPVFSKSDGKLIHFVAVQVPILRKSGHLGIGVARNGVSVCENGCTSPEILLGACRREVFSDSMLDLHRKFMFNSVVDPDKGVVEDLCEASEVEKRKASTAICNILSVLSHYSASTGRLVSGSRCNVQGTGILSSALIIALGRIKQSFVLIDPHLPNWPNVYASDAFLELTGYARHEVSGCSHKFLSGSDTDSSTLLQINESIQSGQPHTVYILSYRKNGSSFWNLLHVSPVRNASGKIAYFIEVHKEDDGKRLGGHVPSPDLMQLGAVGAVKVAVRSLSMGPGPSKS